jgi:hypothetical protein
VSIQAPGPSETGKNAKTATALHDGKDAVGSCTFTAEAQLQVESGQVSCGSHAASFGLSVLSGMQMPSPLQQPGNNVGGCVGASPLMPHAPVFAPSIGS